MANDNLVTHQKKKKKNMMVCVRLALCVVKKIVQKSHLNRYVINLHGI